MVQPQHLHMVPFYYDYDDVDDDDYYYYYLKRLFYC